MVLLISYDLSGLERPSSYTKVKNYIEKHASAFIRPLYSQWFVETSSAPQQWVDALRSNSLIDANDKLFICKVTRPYQGWLTEQQWQWLNAHI
ncbi:MAG: hypothetical protein QOJ38_831 [Solirubrobacterales bacterium]|jgi:hypothetical protein|nr:hypothetical protein [Solirubrobacterales bacterium]